jgi:hypothetical protein
MHNRKWKWGDVTRREKNKRAREREHAEKEPKQGKRGQVNENAR